jgi:protein TonB
MFEASLVESTPLLQPRNRWPALVSFGLQAIVVSALILIPLVHPEVLPLTLRKLEVVAPRFVPPHTPPPLPRPIRVEVATTPAAPAAPTQAPVLQQQAFHTDARALDAPALAVGLNLGGQGPSPLASLSGTAVKGSPIAVAGPPASSASTGPIRISTGVLTGMLLAPISPQYPAIAKLSRTQGTVVVEATISMTGKIESAHIVSGPEMLQAAALQAVRDARYRPFLLNGQPTEVSTTISINFRLGS